MSKNMTAEKARQGTIGHGARYVLGISLLLAIAAFAVVGFAVI
jgi:hypothetical protein